MIWNQLEANLIKGPKKRQDLVLQKILKTAEHSCYKLSSLTVRTSCLIMIVWAS